MTTRILIISIIITSFHAQLFGQQPLKSNIHIGLVYPLSTNGNQAAAYTNATSVHAIAGVSKNETHLCASGVANIVGDTVTGVAAAGCVNVIGRDANGVQCAGIVNYTGNSVNGVAAAGVINISGCATGVQAAGFANITISDMEGLQVAGFYNSARNANTQVAGFINAAGTVKGAQVAGFINVASAPTQVAGFINIADTAKGVQVAGFINVARSAHVQVGIVNIAESCDNSIGLVNLAKNGEQAIGITVNETGTTVAAFRSGGRTLYGIVGLGFNPSYANAYAVQAGLGAHLPISRSVRLNLELSTTWLHDFMGNGDLRSGICLMPAIRLGAFELFAGPSFSYTGTPDMQGLGKVGYSVWDEKTYRWTHDLSIGAQAGIQFHLDGKNVNRQKKTF